MSDAVVATEASALTDGSRPNNDSLPPTALLTEEAAKEALANTVATPNIPDTDGPAPSHVPDTPHLSDQIHHTTADSTQEVGQTGNDHGAATDHSHQQPPNGTVDQHHHSTQQQMRDVPVSAADVHTSESMHMGVSSMVPVSMSNVNMPGVNMGNVSIPPVNMGNVKMGTVNMRGMNMAAVQAVPDQQHTLVKDDEAVLGRQNDETPLVEVAEAMLAANDVFIRVKSEKIAEQALCSIRNDQAQYEGLDKEIVGKAIKQKERERANRASAAASRAKVLRYQTELESRLNRMEAERNAYRKELTELRNSQNIDIGRKMTQDESKQLLKLQEWIRNMEAANPQFVRSVIAQQEMDKLLGVEDQMGERMEFEEKIEDEHNAKRRRTGL